MIKSQKSYKPNSGITLIALVITIIVLLILAGVSLILVMGNEGILKRAEDAIAKYDAESIKEEVQLEIAGLTIQYYEDETIDKSTTSLTEYLKDELAKSISTASGATITVDENGIFTYEKDENEIKGTFNLDTGEIIIDEEKKDVNTIAALSSLITEANYGDYVDLETSLIINDNQVLSDGSSPETDWRIFYEDESGGVYVVLAGYLPYTYESTVGSGLKQYSGGYSWYSTSNTSDFLTRLSNTTAWNKLIPTKYTAKGAQVTGSLDLERLVASLNATGDETLYIKKSGTQYYVGNSENPTGVESSFGAKADDTLYCPFNDGAVKGYWLNTEGGASTYYGIVVANGGTGKCSYEVYNYAIRPMVYLPADTLAQKVGDIWEIVINE